MNWNAVALFEALLLWMSLGLVAYAYAAYPLLARLAAKVCGRAPAAPRLNDCELPTVTLLIVALNEEKWIRERVANGLAQHYPPDRLQIIVASDGSTDQTASIVGSLQDQHPGRIVLHAFAQRRGKATVLNALIPALESEVVVLSDANTLFNSDATMNIARWFADPAVIAACGKLNLVDPVSGRNVDSMYWRYENFLKEQEARLGALLGANGAVYGVRRAAYVPIAEDTIIDDFVIPLLMKLHAGGQIVYDREAIATEETPPTIGDEFNRRARIGAGGFQSLRYLWPLMLPSAGWISVAFISHKLLRWFAPFLLVLGLVANVALSGQPVYRVLLALQVGFYIVAWIGGTLPGNGPLARILRLTTLFTSMNAALAVGFYRWVGGMQKAAWQRTPR